MTTSILARAVRELQPHPPASSTIQPLTIPAGLFCGASVLSAKSDAALVRRSGRRHEALDRVDDGDDLLVVTRELALELGELFGQLLVSRKERPQANKGAHDEDAHLYGAGGIEHGGGHDCAVLGESAGTLPSAATPTV